MDMDPGRLNFLSILHIDIWGTRIPGYEDLNLQLLQEIRVHQAEEQQQKEFSNPGCWRGSKRYTCEEQLLTHIRGNLALILRRYQPNIPLDNFHPHIDYWTNVNSQGAGNSIHAHNLESSDWSGCYYVQGTGTGAIRFHTEQCLHQHIKPYMPFGVTREIHPVDGNLLLFPSYLLHEVMPNPGARERINIAFNITYLPKHK